MMIHVNNSLLTALEGLPAFELNIFALAIEYSTFAVNDDLHL